MWYNKGLSNSLQILGQTVTTAAIAFQRDPHTLNHMQYV